MRTKRWIAAVVLSLLCFPLSSCGIQDALENRKAMQEVAEDLADDGRYYYDQLNQQQQKIYQYLYHACQTYQTEAIFPESVSDEDFAIAYYALIEENPMFYWLKNYEYSYIGDEEHIIKVTFHVPEDVEEVSAQLNAAADAVVAQVDSSWSTYEKVRFLYSWIIQSTVYEPNEFDQDIRSVLLLQKSVCNGYANTFKLFCDRLGIPCMIQVGWASDENHAWNAVDIDGEMYWVDCTWGDSDYEEAGYEPSESMYDYLCVPDDILLQSHELATEIQRIDEMIESPFYTPTCDSWNYEYYVLNGRLFSNYDRSQMHAFLSNAVAGGWYSNITFQFQNEDAYLLGTNDLFYTEEPYIRTILQDTISAGQVQYRVNPYVFTVEISFIPY